MPIATADLVLTAPNRLAHRGREVAVGATVYVALDALLRAGGRVATSDLCAAVWGTEEVAKRTVWSLCHRVGEKLGEVGCDLRCGTDGGDVVLT